MTVVRDRLAVEVIDDPDDFEAIREEWNRAASASADPNVFLTWEWLANWWRHFGATDPTSRLHVVLVRDAEGLAAAAPLFRSTVGSGPLRTTVLRQISFDAGDYGGVLLPRPEQSEHTRAAVERLAEHLAARLAGGVQTVTLSRLPSDSTLLAALRQAVPEHRGLAMTETDLDDACPYADVRNGYDLSRHLKKHKVRQRMRRLSEKYEVSFTHHTGPTLQQGLDDMVDLHRRRWEGREDEFQGLLAGAGQEAFLLDTIRDLDRQGWLRLLTLSADGRPVAVELDFEFAQRVYMFKGAFDPEFAQFSPGQLTHYQVFEDGIGRGVEEFDFLRGDHPYKRRWTNADRRLVTVTLARPGPSGTVARQRVRAARAAQLRLG